MSEPVIRAENLGKKFVIDHKVERNALLRDAVASGARSLLRKGTDLLKGKPPQGNDRREEFWALRDLNFEIRAGELVSIVGRNGAGKSTLLKILSRITEPTTGRVEISGRVNSLLEVGTGFHPELSGRENIFLNGAILGMSRQEIRRRFDEIVAFSGVEKFIDTPVKRYSVGMYARLAFAVAAHLDAEILVIDEVLAVGDAEFQARCLSRMSEVASSGRTVLFVSHNFSAVMALTRRSIVLQAGSLVFDGPVEGGLAHYTSTLAKGGPARQWGRGKSATLVSAELVDMQGIPTERFVPGTPLRLRVVVETDGMRGMALEAILRDQNNLPLAFYSSTVFSQVPLPAQPGRYECILSLDAFQLAAGEYGIDLQTYFTHVIVDHRVDSAVRFSVDTCSPDGIAFNFRQDYAVGPLAMRLTAPLEFVSVPSSGAPDDPQPALQSG